MEDTTNLAGNYRIEVSGWGFDSSFFVETTELFWDRSGDKKVVLRHALSEGAVVFIRLLTPESAASTLPVAYEVTAASAMDCNGQCEIRLKQLHARPKVSQSGVPASNVYEDAKGARERTESSTMLEPEEILQ